jgi:hypothetical protein
MRIHDKNEHRNWNTLNFMELHEFEDVKLIEE